MPKEKEFKKQVLTAEIVKAAARKYYKARKLTAQHKDKDKRECTYILNSYRCAVGAALNEKTVAAMRERGKRAGSMPNGAVDTTGCQAREYFTFPSEKEQDEVRAIQKAHDDWAQEARYYSTSQDTCKTRKEFVKLIGL